MRFHPVAVLVVLILVLGAGPVFADEVELNSGAVFRGTVEKDTETEVVIRTSLGAMTFRKSEVKEVRRDGAGATEDPATSDAPKAPRAVKALSIEGLDPAIRPVLVRNTVFAVKKDGHLGAWSVRDGKHRWRSDIGKGTIVGIAADPGAVYIVTNDGTAARLHGSNGVMVWICRPGGVFTGAPLIFRRGLFAFQMKGGVVGIETANGDVRGRLPLPVGLDTPLGAADASIVFGSADGRLFSITDDGKRLGGAVETSFRWRGRPIAARRRSVIVASKNTLLLFDTGTQKVTKRVPVPGLLGHPFAADANRVYAEVDGSLAAVDSVNGRIAWKSDDVPRTLAVTISGKVLFVTTAGGTVAAISRRDGRLLWSAPLGGRAASPPIPLGGSPEEIAGGVSVLVALHDGRLKSYRGKGADADEVPDPEPGRTPTAPPAASRTIHSPDGYALDVPKGWAASESATRGPVSLGLRPVPEAPRFLLSNATDRDRKLLDVTAYLAVVVAPSSGSTLSALAKRYLGEEKAAAHQGRYTLESEKISELTIGSTKWTMIRVDQVVSRDMMKGTLSKVALVRPLDATRNVWVELKVPELYAKVGVEDLKTLAGSLRADRDFEPSEEVLVAEAAVAAMNRGDLKAVQSHLAMRIRKSAAEWLPKLDGRRVRLVMRRSLPRGKVRDVRVRIDSPTGTDFAGLVLARDADRWVIVHVGGLGR